MTPSDWRDRLRREFETELQAVARWWLEHVIDLARGSIVGEVSGAGRADPSAPLNLVYVARLLWFFSALSRHTGKSAHRAAADLCHARLLRDFSDPQHGGLFWQVAADGQPLERKKQTYGLAFAVYALGEYRRSGARDEALNQANTLARLIEDRLLDRQQGGFFEARDRDWRPLADVRLGPTDLDADKTLNTHLHLLEAWTGLARHDAAAAPRLRDLLQLYLARFMPDPDGTAIGFYTRAWQPLPAGHSPGHAIEASWLMCEAANVLNEPDLQATVHAAALGLAESVLARAIDAEGGVVSELRAGAVVDHRRVWWVQAEAMVGFFNAWQLDGDERFLQASHACWAFIREHHVDPKHGEWRWYSALDTDAPETVIAGAWKAPYHNGRALLEMLRRLDAQR
jgi:mannobiose 2-epimerase